VRGVVAAGAAHPEATRGAPPHARGVRSGGRARSLEATGPATPPPARSVEALTAELLGASRWELEAFKTAAL
jgi:hypothetical protein